MTHIHAIAFQECKQLVLCGIAANTQLMSSRIIKAVPIFGRIEVHFKSSFLNSETQQFIYVADIKPTQNQMKICGIFEMTNKLQVFQNSVHYFFSNSSIIVSHSDRNQHRLLRFYFYIYSLVSVTIEKNQRDCSIASLPANSISLVQSPEAQQ